MFTTEEDFQRPDWQLVQNSAVSLFWNNAVLDETRESLLEIGYGIAEVVCRRAMQGFMQQVSDVLLWEDQFGYQGWDGNLDALNDGFRYYPFDPSGRSALISAAFSMW